MSEMNAVEEFMNYAVAQEVKFRLGNSEPTQFSYSRRRKPYHITMKYNARWSYEQVDWMAVVASRSAGQHGPRKHRVADDDGRTYKSVEITVKNPKTGDWAALTVRRLNPEEMMTWMTFAFEFLGIPLDYAPTAPEARALAAERARRARQASRENGRKSKEAASS